MKKLLLLVLVSAACLQASEPSSSSSSSGFGPRHGLFGRGKWRNATPEQREQFRSERATNLKAKGWTDDEIAALSSGFEKMRTSRQGLSDSERAEKRAAMRSKWRAMKNATPAEREAMWPEKEAKLKGKGLTDEEIAARKKLFSEGLSFGGCRGGRCRDWKNATEEEKEQFRAEIRAALIAEGKTPAEADEIIAARKAKWAARRSARRSLENEMMSQG